MPAQSRAGGHHRVLSHLEFQRRTFGALELALVRVRELEVKVSVVFGVGCQFERPLRA